ncbi:MAG: hypothetical protein JWP78_3100 [Mucilaginibacter sp.]|nr:hypothetical protein [Mucilaginibacter sp.]
MTANEVENCLDDHSASLGKQAARITVLENRLPDLSLELSAIREELVIFNTDEKLDLVIHCLNGLNDELARRPQAINRSYRILLFPESGLRDYYKIVFGRLLPWGILLIALTYLFLLGQKALAPRSEEAREGRYTRSWIYLDRHAGKKMHKAMQEALERTADAPN